MTTPSPTLAGFLTFIRNVMGIKATNLPDNSPAIPLSFAVALAIVNPSLQAACIPSVDAAGVTLNAGGETVYSLAVYNLAGSNLLSFAQDQAGDTFFQELRDKLNLNGFTSGVVQSSSDEGTSVSLVVQEAAKEFTLANLQQLKDPYGRRYLALAQSYGPSTWGMC